ncbi:MAG: Gfo/Idh/MocA family oxidoreductase [Candidatus Bathyarchaeia archaeon]
MRKRYALAGASSRALFMYAKPLSTELKDYAELVGVYDINPLRAKILSEECGGIQVYDSFEKMMQDAKPDATIITTVDRFHHEYIIRTLEAGCDAITEKPMTIDAEKCKAILDAERRTGKKVIVTFNYRFAPYASRIKELIKEGIVGEILSIDFEWILDTVHGASYFRRWHRYMRNSGGLLVHKATHHFDIINWWLADDPELVFAFGARRFYGPTRKERWVRCLTCPYKKTCEFYWDITKDQFARRFYLEAEKTDGYIRDGCVFADDIDIYDTMSVNVRYSKGAFLTYSLIAHSPYEGWRASINGTKGRLEAEEFHSGQRVNEPIQQIRYYNRKGEVITYNIEKPRGPHGGGDERLRRMLFVGDIEDNLGYMAGSWAGAMSILIGVASNISIAEKRPVAIKDLLQ